MNSYSSRDGEVSLHGKKGKPMSETAAVTMHLLSDI